jgi:uncharacterized protein YjbI with pentapeptide repeats
MDGHEIAHSSIYLYASPGGDRLPVYRYFNRDFGDVFLTTSWSELAYGFASWDYVGIVGYAHDWSAPGTIRLYRWFNDRTGRHAYTTIQDPSWLNVTDGWAMEGQMLYIPEVSKGKLGLQHEQCMHPGCTNRAFGSIAGCCLDHIDSGARESALDSVIDIDQNSRTANLSELSMKSSDWLMILDRLSEALGDPVGWLLDLSGITIAGNIRLKVPDGVTLDLSSSHVVGDIELRNVELSRLVLSGIKVKGSLVLRDILIRDAIFADHIEIDELLRAHKISAASKHVHFDAANANRVAISDSDFGVLSYASSSTAIRSVIENSKVDNLVCTGMIAAQDWALRRCSIGEYAGFRHASITAHLNLEFNKFEGLVDLSELSVGDAIHLADSRYAGDVVLNRINTGSLDMHNSYFQGRITNVESQIGEVLDLRNSKMLEPVLLVGNPRFAILDDTVFSREVTLQLNGTSVSARRTRFETGSRISGSNDPARLLDLANTDLSGVQLDEADLSFCCFAKALNVEQMRFVGAASFATVPRRFNWTPWYRWRAARKVIWEEIILRADDGIPGWREWRDQLSAGFITQPNLDFDWGLPIPGLITTGGVTPRKLISVYRDLRRSQEGSDEEPEGNEFYYSEMTIRRQNAVGWRRGILLLYWILGGYGVRPSRPLISFGLFAWLIASGFVQLNLLISPGSASDYRIGYVGAFNYLLHTSISLLGNSGLQPREFVGLILDLLARLLLPTLLALMFLGIRANVKRGR